MTQQNFELPELLDYSVRMPRGGNTGALTECTITWSGDHNGNVGKNLRTRGVPSNQVYAAVEATFRTLNPRLATLDTRG